jgi:choline dehydrogenase
MENHGFGESEYHGNSGPLTVDTSLCGIPPIGESYLKACREAGLSDNPDFNGVTQEGIGNYHINTRNGRRMSASRAYLWPIRKRPNLRIETYAQATRILFEGSQATGIEYVKNGQQYQAQAAKEVILSAGAINSPQLLLLSGIGPTSELSSLGIDVVRDISAVGKNLQDHYGVDHTYLSNQTSLNNQLHSGWSKLWAGMQYGLARRGPLARNINHAGGFFRTRAELERPNMQLYFSPLTYQKDTPGSRPLLNPDPFAAFNIGISQCRPTSRGYLRLKTPDPMAAPEIQPNYLSTEHDLQENLEGVRFFM